MAFNVEFCHKSDHANFIVNKYDYINLNVITVTMDIILNYGYGINSIEHCINWYKCQIIIICSNLSQYPYFELILGCFLAICPLLMVILK